MAEWAMNENSAENLLHLKKTLKILAKKLQNNKIGLSLILLLHEHMIFVFKSLFVPFMVLCHPCYVVSMPYWEYANTLLIH